VVDGRLQDWQGKVTSYFEKQQAVIGVANDADNLYIHFRTKDVKWAGLIRRTGLTIYVDNEGGKDKRFFVRLFDGPAMEAMRWRGDIDTTRPEADNPAPLGERMRSDRPGEQKRFTCFVEDRIVEMPIAFDGSMGPRAAYDTCWGFYSFEFSLPLRESVVRYYGIDAVPGQQISIGAVWGDMSDTNRPRGEETGEHTGGGMMPPDGEMPPGGGMPGGGMRPGGGRPGMQAQEKQEIWFKTVLASSGDMEENAQK